MNYPASSASLPGFTPPSDESHLKDELAASRLANTMLRDERDLLRVQLQAFQGMPYVPKADYQRMAERAESAERRADGMTRDAANREDLAAYQKRTVDVMKPIGKMLEKFTPADNEREALWAFYDWLAEAGARGADIEAHRAAYEAWEQRVVAEHGGKVGEE